MIYADFESILVSENNRKQNPNYSCTNKYQKDIACNYGYKLVCLDNKPQNNISKKFKPYLGEVAVYNFISNVTGKSKYSSYLRKKYFNKELLMTKKVNEDFENSTKCQVCGNYYIECDVKVRRVHCHITEKYKGSAYRDCNINGKINHKIPVVYDNLKNYDSHFVMQELGN